MRSRFNEGNKSSAYRGRREWTRYHKSSAGPIRREEKPLSSGRQARTTRFGVISTITMDYDQSWVRRSEARSKQHWQLAKQINQVTLPGANLQAGSTRYTQNNKRLLVCVYSRIPLFITYQSLFRTRPADSASDELATCTADYAVLVVRVTR